MKRAQSTEPEVWEASETVTAQNPGKSRMRLFSNAGWRVHNPKPKKQGQGGSAHLLFSALLRPLGGSTPLRDLESRAQFLKAKGLRATSRSLKPKLVLWFRASFLLQTTRIYFLQGLTRTPRIELTSTKPKLGDGNTLNQGKGRG